MSEEHVAELDAEIICIQLWSAGITTDGGQPPRCVGMKCSSYLRCVADRIAALAEINKMDSAEEKENPR